MHLLRSRQNRIPDLKIEIELVRDRDLSPIKKKELDRIISRSFALPPMVCVVTDADTYLATNADTGQIIGYANTIMNWNSVHFLLAGVDPAFQSNGVYKALLRRRFDDILADPEIVQITVNPTKVVLRTIKKYLRQLKRTKQIGGYKLTRAGEDVYIGLKR